MKINKKLSYIDKKVRTAVAASIIAVMASTSVYAQGTIPICVQNQQVNLGSDSPYISSQNQTMIPIKAVGKVLGLNVNWQSPCVTMSGKDVRTNKTVTVKANTKTGLLTVNGTTLKNAVDIKNGRSYFSLRALAESFGYGVKWSNGRVDITGCETTKPSPSPVPTTKPSPSPVPTTTPSPAPTPSPTTPADNSVVAYENKVLELVNVERQKAGIAALKMDETIRNVARMKSQDMQAKRYFDHNSPTYGSPFDMMKQFGITYKSAGENIAMGQRTPEEVVKGWMNSPGHRANILNASFNYIGVGYVANGNYWTQMFVGR